MIPNLNCGSEGQLQYAGQPAQSLLRFLKSAKHLYTLVEVGLGFWPTHRGRSCAPQSSTRGTPVQSSVFCSGEMRFFGLSLTKQVANAELDFITATFCSGEMRLFGPSLTKSVAFTELVSLRPTIRSGGEVIWSFAGITPFRWTQSSPPKKIGFSSLE